MRYIGGEIDRLIVGRYRVRLDIQTPDGWDRLMTEPADRYDVLLLMRAAASGVHIAGGRVLRAQIVGPVNPSPSSSS